MFALTLVKPKKPRYRNNAALKERKAEVVENSICNNLWKKKCREEGYNKAVGLNEMHPVENVCLSHNGSDWWISIVTVLYVSISPHGSQSS